MLAATARRLAAFPKRTFSHDIPSPRGLPIIGTTLAIMAAGSAPNLHKYVDGRHKQLGPVFREKMGAVTAIFVSDADEMGAIFTRSEGKYPKHLLPDAWILYNQLYGCSRGLFFMDDATWWYHRKIMNKLLLKGDLGYINEACELAADNFIRNAITDNAEKSLETVLYKWSLENVIAVLLGAQTFAGHSPDLEEHVELLASTINAVFDTSAKLTLIPAKLAHKLNIKAWRRFVAAVGDALGSTNRLVERLVRISQANPSCGLLPKLLKESVDVDTITKIIADLILAAGDTTAYTMEWMLYQASLHPDRQTALRNSGNYRDFLKETLRLHPVAPFLTRILPEASTVCGYAVPEMSTVVMSIYSSGRDRKYYHEPELFRPERWDRSDAYYKPVMQKASLPFAMGLRSCVGRRLAETQLTLTMEKIMTNFEIALCNERPIDMVMKMVAVPSEPIKLKFKPLKNM